MLAEVGNSECVPPALLHFLRLHLIMLLHSQAPHLPPSIFILFKSPVADYLLLYLLP